MEQEQRYNFVSLHNHSDYSLFDAISKYSDMIKKTLDLGMSSLGISEHGTTSGLLDFYLKCTEAGVHPILGCEFYLSTDLDVKSRDNVYHICLFAKDFNGYKNLNRLNSFAQQHIYYKPRISFSKLREFSNGLICTSACLGGLLASDDSDEYCALLQDIFGEDFYLEFQFNSLREQAPYNESLMFLSKKYNVKRICAIDSHYVNKEDAYVHRMWKGIREDSESVFNCDDFYMYGGREMFKRITRQFTPSIAFDMLENTCEIASKCNCVIEQEDLNYPVFPADNQKELLVDICRDGAREKLDLPLTPNYIARIKKELDLIEKASYTNYFLIIWDLCRWADNVSHICRGVGRGSVVGSLVAYLCGITGLDALRLNLVFERFLHMERVTPCDIDLDFQSSRRDDVIDYLREKYGYVYNVRTFNYISASSGLQRAGQALRLPPSDVLALSKGCSDLGCLPAKYHSKGISNEQYDQLIFLATKFQGLLQNYGKHASAVMVFPDEVERWAAIEVQDGTPVVNYDFHLLEGHCGLLKLDILGIATLDVVDGCIQLIKDRYGSFPYDINNLPWDDSNTFKMLGMGFTTGCFQLESGGMTNLVMQLQPERYEDLIPLVALYRPGTLKAGMTDQFVRRSTGKERISYIVPSLESVMKDTMGICLYQEQVMQMVQIMAGYTLGQADMFRRAIGRKDIALMAEILPPFIKVCVENGYTHEEAQGVADYISGCSDYLFNKGHSAGYGYVSYQTAFLKANYKLEYMCSLLNVYVKDTESQVVYMSHCKKIGVPIYPPSLDSKYDWSISGKGLLVGVSAIKHVGNTKFDLSDKDFVPFLKNNVTVNRRSLEFLIKAGVFGNDRDERLKYLDFIKNEKTGYKRKLFCLEKYRAYADNPKKSAEWFAKAEEIVSPELNLIEDTSSNAKFEMESLGYTFYDVLDDYDLDICDYYSDLTGVCVEKVKPWKTKTGKPMAFFKGRSKFGTKDYTIFGEHSVGIEVGSVYIVRLNSRGIVEEISSANLHRSG